MPDIRETLLRAIGRKPEPSLNKIITDLVVPTPAAELIDRDSDPLRGYPGRDKFIRQWEQHATLGSERLAMQQRIATSSARLGFYVDTLTQGTFYKHREDYLRESEEQQAAQRTLQAFDEEWAMEGENRALFYAWEKHRDDEAGRLAFFGRFAAPGKKGERTTQVFVDRFVSLESYVDKQREREEDQTKKHVQTNEAGLDNTERTNVERELVALGLKITRIRHTIAGLKASGGDFGSAQEELNDLYKQKNRLIASALILRQNGDTAIELSVTGDPQDQLHSDSRNQIAVIFQNPISGRIEHTAVTSLRHLQKDHGGDVLDLVIAPEKWREESSMDRMSRLFSEIKAIDHARREAKFSGGEQKVWELHVLQIKLVEKLLQMRVSGDIKGVECTLAYIKAPTREGRDIIVCRYAFGNRGASFTILAPHLYPFENRLEELIKAGGGYDTGSERR